METTVLPGTNSPMMRLPSGKVMRFNVTETGAGVKMRKDSLITFIWYGTLWLMVCRVISVSELKAPRISLVNFCILEGLVHRR